MQLHLIDVPAIVLYLLGITWFGLRFRNGERSLRSYFLADRNIPWWAIALSIVAAETSTLTIISIPGLAFTGDFGFLQIALGYLLGRIVICLLFLPRYFEGQLMTAYQLIGARFGKGCIASPQASFSSRARRRRASASSPSPSSSRLPLAPAPFPPSSF